MGKKGKRLKQVLDSLDRERLYAPGEGLRILKAAATAKFDETIELNAVLGIDPRKADQNVRGTVILPHGTGKSMRVVTFAQGDKAREAKEAGADEVGDQDLADRIQNGWTDFDVAIATPDMMPVVGKLGRILGPRNLMPNPKAGTVTNDVAKAIKDAKGGKIEYKTDGKQPVINTIIGKASFSLEALADNYLALVDELLRAKPAAAKGKYLKSLNLSSTMGPGVRIDPNAVRDVALPKDGEAEPALAAQETG
jgi:large subunit ribosomal protein L1